MRLIRAASSANRCISASSLSLSSSSSSSESLSSATSAGGRSLFVIDTSSGGALSLSSSKSLSSFTSAERTSSLSTVANAAAFLALPQINCATERRAVAVGSADSTLGALYVSEWTAVKVMNALPKSIAVLDSISSEGLGFLFLRAFFFFFSFDVSSALATAAVETLEAAASVTSTFFGLLQALA